MIGTMIDGTSSSSSSSSGRRMSEGEQNERLHPARGRQWEVYGGGMGMSRESSRSVGFERGRRRGRLLQGRRRGSLLQGRRRERVW